MLYEVITLSKTHSVVLVEGMGGIMTPILKNYFVIDLIKDMRIPSVLVTRTKVGTVNHTLMTVQMCQKYKIPIKGIIINDFDSDGYNVITSYSIHYTKLYELVPGHQVWTTPCLLLLSPWQLQLLGSMPF